MKLDDYINILEDLKSKYGNVDVKVNKTFECTDLSINDTYSDQKNHTLMMTKNVLLYIMTI